MVGQQDTYEIRTDYEFVPAASAAAASSAICTRRETEPAAGALGGGPSKGTWVVGGNEVGDLWLVSERFSLWH